MKKLAKKLTLGLAVVAPLALASTAHATDAGTVGDFDGFYDQIKTWVTGGLGRTIGIIGLGVGAVQILRNAYTSAAGFVAIGLLLSLGPGVVESIMGAVV